MDLIKEKWEEILERVRVEYELTDVAFRTFLKPLTIYKAEDSTITILVPTERVGLVNWILWFRRTFSLKAKRNVLPPAMLSTD